MKRKNISDQDKNISRSLLLWETRNRKKKTAAFVCAFLAVLVALATVVQMIRPAVAVTKEEDVLDCGYEVHAHSDDCYRILYDEAGNETGKELICGKADYVVHNHTDECYRTIVHEDEGVEEKVLVCELPEIEAHVHDDSCYEEKTELICTEEHEHDESCYEAVKVLTCDKPELHTHDETCYDENNALICGKIELKEHTHSEACMSGSDEFKEEPVQEVSDMSILYPAQSFEQVAGDLQIKAEAAEGTLPADTVMTVQEIGTEEMMETLSSAVDKEIVRTQALDITFYNSQDMEIEPLMPVNVSVVPVYDTETETPVIVQVDEQGEAAVVENVTIESEDGETLVFETDTNTVSAIVYTVKEKIIASDGQNYKITVSYGEETGIPEDAELLVEEISEESENYAVYIEQSQAVLGIENASYVRLFDISIVNKYDYSFKYQPAAGTAVDVKIELADSSSDHLNVVHFADQEGTAEVVENNTVNSDTGSAVQFAADGFSVYAIVDAPEPVTLGKVNTLNELESNYTREFLLSYNGNNYFTNSMNSYDCFIETRNINNASSWYLEKGDGNNVYYVYTLIDQEKRYMYNKSGNLMALESESKTAFELSQAADGKFYFKVVGANKWLQHSNGGGGIRLYTDNNNAANSQISLTYMSLPDDVYSLDGKTYGIAYHNDSVAAAAMTVEASTAVVGGAEQHRLGGLDLVMKPDVLDNIGILLVAEGSDLQEFTFSLVKENYYHITTNVDGQIKYLTMRGNSITLEDTPDEVYSLIRAIPGTDANKGKWHFSVNNYSLNYLSSAKSFNAATGSNSTTWLNLAEKSIIEEDDFSIYSAKKVSVSDEINVYDGQQVVIYTRIWNETEKKYEFFAVDHNGLLIPCYDAGDTVKWIGSQVNSVLWNFTEYTDTDRTPTYFYELQNTQYGEYIAPQVTGGQILSDSTIGINLNGRRNGENQTTIIAWDDMNYAYVGLKCENGHIVACPLSEAEDFYFAVVNPVETEDQLTEVKTIDNDKYGITMKMIDFDNPKTGTADSPRDSVQDPFFGGSAKEHNIAGLLSSGLNDDGYPETTEKANTVQYPNVAGHSLSELFNDMTPVNHLLIDSVYNESGYFEYNSTSNFAHLNDDGNFTVYDQLGAISDYGVVTGTHGQFMPYNSLTPGKYCTFTNQTTVTKAELEDTNPRKGEKLYDIGKRSEVHYHFGMEMEASFTQTPNGLDNWGHDIIFEFSGDDDFWLYVDGELILDLGGVHEAMTGKVNFRTGQVTTSSRGNSTIYQLFKDHYQERGMTEVQIQEKLDELFTINENGQYVFKDYTQHTMKMFYMERGAGASNLYMRFNLSSVKPGTFILSKKLSGTEKANNDLIEFPYQIYYTLNSDEGAVTHRLDNPQSVVYRDTTARVKYLDSFTPADGTVPYQNVFFLKPGQSAEVTLPEDVREYYVVECGVNPDIYDHVYVNGTELIGSETQNGISGTARQDYAVERASLKQRAEVNYDNHVHEGAMRQLKITKRLYDTEGNPTHASDGSTVFTFRLYLGSENADESQLPLADMYEYCIKDADGNYCIWNAAEQKFNSLGKTDYSTLTDSEKEAATFQTSMNGSISKIPVDYSVEVRNLVIGTKYKVEERDWEIPKGYTRRDSDGYTRVDVDPDDEKGVPYTDTIKKDEDPEIEVRNQEGWGLTVEKIWTDKDFMESHDDIYFAVYLNDAADGEPEDLKLYEGTVRRLSSNESELYYFLDDLKYTDPDTHEEKVYEFSKFVIKEVQLENAVVDDNGYVTGYSSITPIDMNGTLVCGGKPYGGEHQDGYSYTVTYEVGEKTGQNENIRTDKVTNSRPGIALYKSDWQGCNEEGTIINPLEGAVFTLKDENGQDVAAEAYTSRADGLITIAYLNAGTYTLKEVTAPAGYAALPSEAIITVESDSTVTVSGIDDLYYTVTSDETSGMTAVITIHNRQTEFNAVKKDRSDEAVLKNVHFALYRQVKDNDGNYRRDYQPMTGYEDLVTDENGIIPNLTMDLNAGTYYLSELQAAEGYGKLADDICFTIGGDGKVVLNSSAGSHSVSETTDTEIGKATFTLTVYNDKLQNASFKKVDIADIENSKLAGAVFNLYKVVNGEQEENPLYVGMVSRGDDGLLVYQGNTVFALEQGEYHLVETAAPDGYSRLTQPVTVTVTSSRITYETPDTPNLSSSGNGISYNETDNAYTLLIANSSGYELPQSGGIGTIGYQLAGGLLVLLALILKFRKH